MMTKIDTFLISLLSFTLGVLMVAYLSTPNSSKSAEQLKMEAYYRCINSASANPYWDINRCNQIK